MSVAHRWGRITKYTCTACLTLAILSTLVLNIISSYSNSSTRSNAEPVSNSSTSTLANNNDSSTCDPSNTNAESCISLSITSSSSSTSTGGDDANLSLQIPRKGGVATGRHTVEVSSNNVTGYYVTLTGNAGSPAMTPSTTTSQAFIQSTAGTLASPSPLAKGQWGSWGIALPNSSLYPGFNTNEADYSSTSQDVLTKTTWAAVPGKEADDGSKTIIKTTTSSKKTDSYPIYYGVRVDSPVSVPADTYAAQVVYTATTNEVPTPTMTSINPDQYELGSGASGQVTITGTNLLSAYDIYLQSPSDTAKKFNCTNISIASSGNSLTCTLPTDASLGVYDLYVTAQGGTGSLAGAFSYTESLPDGMDRVSDDYGTDGHVAVDYDENMIPVVYDETAKTWRVVTNAELQQNPKNWYDYTKKQWANALTVSKSSLQSFRDKQTGVNSDPLIQTNNNPDILGYWVYIPRYAYEVQRRDAVDRVVDPQNFDIVFQTASEENAPALSCNSADKVWVNDKPVEDAGSNSTDILSKDYRTGCWPNDRTYVANSNDTTWATHPAFTWGDEPIGGFWIGKFETTGTRVSPTVKPNQMANVDESFGSFVTMSKHIGAYDSDNTGGSDVVDGSVILNVAGEWNSLHNLLSTTSHMLKNSEWGAVTYLTHSKFGAGINPNNGTSNTLKNGARPQSSTDADGEELEWGATGCGPLNDKGNSYTSIDGVGLPALSANHIEDSLACGDADHAYNGSLGVYASTTNNVYGVYDMAGGAGEYVAGNLTDYPDRSYSSSMNDTIEEPMLPPYVDLYVAGGSPPNNFDNKPIWYPSSVTKGEYYNFGACTFETCGGTATYETTAVQAVSDYYQGWGESNAGFVYGSGAGLWFLRGDRASMAGASLFTSDGDMGYEFEWDSYRVALLPPLSVD